MYVCMYNVCMYVCRDEEQRDRVRGRRDRERDRVRDREGDRGREERYGSRSARARAWEEETPQNRAGGDTPYARRSGMEDGMYILCAVCYLRIFSYRYFNSIA